MSNYDWDTGPEIPWQDVYVLRDRLKEMKIGDFLLKDLPLIMRIMSNDFKSIDDMYPTKEDVERIRTAIWEIDNGS